MSFQELITTFVTTNRCSPAYTICETDNKWSISNFLQSYQLILGRQVKESNFDEDKSNKNHRNNGIRCRCINNDKNGCKYPEETH